MYIPNSFRETDQQKLHAFISANSFATLISSTAKEPTASHLPLLLNDQAGSQGELIGHMARANPQWKSAADQQVLSIFHGPHAYISSAWYQAENVVPTWNYVAVHVYGRFELDDSRERRLEIVQQYMQVYENAGDTTSRAMSADAQIVETLLDGIVGFRIAIERIEGKWKLSQNHDEQRRSRVVQALQSAGTEQQNQIALLMQQTLADT